MSVWLLIYSVKAPMVVRYLSGVVDGYVMFQSSPRRWGSFHCVGHGGGTDGMWSVHHSFTPSVFKSTSSSTIEKKEVRGNKGICGLFVFK